MSKKMTLPPINLDLTLEAGKQKGAISVATGKNTDFIVPVDQLRVLPGFNVRVRETDDYQGHVESLKQSIRENGYYQNKPLAGFIGKDGEADVIYVTDGHTRLEAVNAINAEAVDDNETIPGLPISLKPADSSIADLTIALVQENSGRPLTPYEQGVVVSRLMGMKNGDEPLFDKETIAKRLSVTGRYIDDLLVLVGAPAKVRTAVLEGNVSSTLAIETLRKTKDPKKAEEKIVAAVNSAKAAGKSKATKKHLAGPKMQTIRHDVSLGQGDSVKAVLAAIAGKVREVTGIPADAESQALTTDGSITIAITVPAPEPAPAPAAAKPAAAKPAAKPTAAKKSGGGAKKSGGGAKKSGGGAKPAAAAAPAPAPEAAPEAPAPEATSEDDGEQAIMPPSVPTVDNDDPDDI